MTDAHSTSRIADCQLVELNRNHHSNGNLTVVEGGVEVPFSIKRCFYLYDVPAGADRGGHSHRTLKQYIVAISGCFDVVIDDGVDRRTVTLNRPFQALMVNEGIWSSLGNFSSGSVCLVITSDYYDESDYVRDYDEFLRLTACKRK